MNESMRSMIGAAGTLALFAAVASAVLSGTWLGTRDAIAQAQQKRLVDQISAVLTTGSFDNNPLQDRITLPGANALGPKALEVYRARLDGQAVAVVFEVVAPDGYSGDIRLLVGITTAGTLSGVRVLGHRETPGLGDRIELDRDDWILGFDGRELDAATRWAVRKDGGDFDQFTGATITPRAVVAAVQRALQYFAANRAALLAPAVKA